MGSREKSRLPPYYDRDFAERELTVDSIGAQGRLLLFRALNIGRVVGFVGSGVSSAYGRPTWSRLIDILAEQGNAHLDEQLAGRLDEYDRHRLEGLRDALLKVNAASVPGVSDPDLLPLRAQLYRNVASDPPQDHASEDIVQQFTKRMTRNDDFVAYDMWARLKGEKPDVKKLEIERDWRAYDTNSNVATAIKDAGSDASMERRAVWEDLRQAFTNRQEAAARPHSNQTDRASSEERLLILLVLAELKLNPRENLHAKIKSSVKTLVKRNAPVLQNADARRGRTYDPIRIILEDLKIRRMLTTNYDFELEMGLERLGFKEGALRPHPEAKDSARFQDGGVGKLTAERPLGDRACSMVFKKETAAELTAFAARAQPNHDYEIFHLHGRAMDGPDERLVITERDYQDAYLRNTPEAHVMDEALTAAMGGNPILFVGMGMMEADLLRPLRRFVAGPHAQLNRSIIALMPTEEAPSRRTRTAILLYLRYGVHLIYYSGGSRSTDPNKPVDPVDPKTPWLSQRERSVIQAEKASRSKDAKKAADAKILLEERGDDALLFLSIERLIEVRRLIEDPKGRASLVSWMGRQDHKEDDPFKVVRDCLTACGPGTEPCHIAASLNVARLMLSDAELLNDDFRRTQLKDFLAQVDGRVRTRALCHSLRQIGKERGSWWRLWREPPQVRSYKHLVESLAKSEKNVAWQAMPGRDFEPYLASKSAGPIRSVRYDVLDRADRPDLVKPLKLGKDEGSIDAAIDVITEEKHDPGRRIFIVQGRIGAGRGEFFHAMSHTFASYVSERDEKSQIERKKYQWGLFTNANFSTEYSSVIDGVNNFLWRCSSPLVDPPRGTVLTRKGALGFHLQRLYSKDNGGNRKQRGLLLIGGVELLFRSRTGTAKNLEIVEALSTLLDPALRGLEDDKTTFDFPIDVVITCRKENSRQIFGEHIESTPNSQGLTDHLRFGNVPGGPQFAAQVIELEAPDVRDRIRARYMEVEPLRPIVEVYRGRDPATALIKTVSDPVMRGELEDTQPADWRAGMQTRFSSSVVLDCAAQTFNQAYADAKSSRRDVGIKAMTDFFNSLGDQRSRATESAGSDLAIAVVLAQYERLDRHYSAPVNDKNVSPKLCVLLLKYLSIICAPVETIVFLRCPEIEEFLDDPSNKIPTEERVQRIHQHLIWLENRSLVFQIVSRSELANSEQNEKNGAFSRFVVHHSLQSYFLRRMGSAHVELGDSRLFTVSAYPIQPSGVPTPSFETYKHIRALLRQLISYPSKGWLEVTYKNETERREAACALRAGVSLARSAFSLGVVSRFSEYASEKTPGNFGFMEEYRLLLRWMIFQSGWIGISVIKGGDGDEGDEKREQDYLEALEAVWKSHTGKPLLKTSNRTRRRLYWRSRFNALYQDEVTWLYNECALVSYVQGNIPDSLALYNRALESNKLVETKTVNGPNALRIRLNRAICEIDRGMIDRANTDLREIWRQYEREPVIAAAARGYMGVIAHLKGRVDQARRYYKRSIMVLRSLGESRALSIFQRHYGDLERPHDITKARTLLAAALAEAETTRQMDLVQRIRISIARCDLSSGSDDADKAPHVLRRLDEVTRYADVMEVHSLKIDALLVRSLGISIQGETRTAGEHAVTALSLSTLYGLHLRAVFAMARLGVLIKARRGFEAQGQRLLDSARAMAEAYNYQPAREAIGERLLL